jgi:DNA polymerase-3 subunit epsilon
MFTVIDVETTGLSPFRNDRVIEIAAVVVDSKGNIIREFVSLVNPMRDVGPTRIHGLRARDVAQAPTFRQILPAFLETVSGTTALVGHQLRFDLSFLQAEFERLGLEFPDATEICTLELAGGGSLSTVCKEFGISFSGNAHAAQNDARATAKLFAALIADEPSLENELAGCPPIQWPKVSFERGNPLRRDELAQASAPAATYLQRLMPKVDPEPSGDLNYGALLAYSALLAQVLEDRQIDDEEADALVELATKWSIPSDQIQAIHRDFLRRIEVAALSDGIVTEDERKDIHHVANLLGIGASNLDEIINQAAQHLEASRVRKLERLPVKASDLSGKTVCFTGEFQSFFEGKPITREMAIEIVEARGLVAAKSVTKRLDLLVASDSLSQSGKANKARSYGISILAEEQFWKVLGLEVDR